MPLAVAGSRQSSLLSASHRYWDERSEKCFYFNKCTGDRSETQPPSFSPDTRTDRNDSVVFMRKRNRFMRDLHQNAPSGVHKFVVARAGVLQETYKHLTKISEEVLKLRFQIEYKGELGIDSGGLSKVGGFAVHRAIHYPSIRQDWFLLVSRKLVASEEGEQACVSRSHRQSSSLCIYLLPVGTPHSQTSASYQGFSVRRMTRPTFKSTLTISRTITCRGSSLQERYESSQFVLHGAL